MCVSNKRLLPLSANNGDVVIFNSTTMRWESSAGNFTQADADENILGNWSFDLPVLFNGQVSDPTGISSPTYGFLQGADMSDNLFYKNSLGGIMRFRTSSISGDLTYDLPTETGTFALKGKTGIHFDSDANISASSQILKDPANNSLPIALTTNQVEFTGNGLVSASAFKLTGTWYRGGSATTTKPFINIEPVGTTSNNWNTEGTGLGINAASGFLGDLINCQINGVQYFNVSRTGLTSMGGINWAYGGGSYGRILPNGNGIVVLYNSAANDFNRIQLGGSTNLFPSLKRVSDSIEIRLADDSASANLSAGIISSNSGRINMSSSGTFAIRSGAGSPEGVITATPGSLYMRTDGDAVTSLYVKGTGTGNTGWVAK